MTYAKITGLASYVPDSVLDNDMLSKMVDTNDEWITTRVGIKERRILHKEGVGSSYLGAQAVKRLLKETGTKAKDIDLVICPTSNPDYRFPSTASIICGECGLKNAYAYDIQAACAGFIVGLQDARAYIQSHLYKKVIVVAAEKMSSMVDYKDRQTCPLFGDGAGAALIEPSHIREGIIDAVFHVDPDGRDHLLMKGGGSARPTSPSTLAQNEHVIFQDGRHVYKNAVFDMLDSTQAVMRRNKLNNNSVDWFVPHQANLRIIEAVGDRLKIPRHKVLVNIQKYGNTSAASIPLCLNEFKGQIRKGDNVVLTAFGAGYTWGAMYIVW